MRDVHIASDVSLNGAMTNRGSSQGLTDDFRVKADIAGVGTDIYSATDVSV
ncbi:hypothetical protein QQ020_01610 [Fulvivirgaceae bacterium BMA12]|uniref:Uncharacterized protein n=1 Tax=Agaribacillus aureus TaxID=3051825 RepID=A0ABT8KYZ6_9BACT|nr:hypothetical protein [Fulvivirgaceae bacterium BMA12]